MGRLSLVFLEAELFPAGEAPPPNVNADARLQRVRDHLRRYQDLVSKGRWSDAGKELEAIEAEVNRKQ